MTLQSVLGCRVCSALEKQSVPRSKVFFDAKCASAERLKRNFYSLGYYFTPNTTIHQSSTQKLAWNFLVTLALTVAPCKFR